MTPLRITITSIAALAVLAAGPVAAHAQELDVELRLYTPKKDDSGDAPPVATGSDFVRPIFRAVITARPGLVEKDFTVKQVDVEPPVAVTAAKAVTFKESDEPMTLVILIQGNFRWMGNETYLEPENEEGAAVYDGAFQGLAPAVDDLTKMGPARSRGALLVYADGKAIAKQGMGDIASVTGTSLGSQADYQEYISKPLVVGLTEAWKLFTAPEAAETRKILVVIGDGNDDKEDVSADLNKVLDDLKKAKVEAYSIHYVAKTEDGPQGQQNMLKIGYEGHYNATSRKEFAAYAGSISQYVGGKYYVDFPSDDINMDGQPHEFAVAVGDEESDAFTLELPEPPVAPKPKEESLWWLWLIIIGAVVLILIIIIIIIAKRKKPEPMPEPMPELDVPPPEPAVRKTVMLGVGGTEDSIPIVGWVVPMQGPNQYQTFKLLQGATKLGTGGGAHVVVSDEFMSTEHAEIVCSQAGFILNDLGSTNGTYVNERRISSHELVDNDVFKLGGTDFKFKSIN